MASYGYGGGYTTTSYGAQGGADGGGFVPGGSQGGSQDTPGGGPKTYGKDTVRPVTVRQLINASQPHPSADFKIDGSDITHVSFIGQVRSISTQATNNTYRVDDGTGTIDVKEWVDAERVDSGGPLPASEDQYIHVWGRLKDFNGKRHVGCNHIRRITDFNEISYHFLDVVAVHLYFTKGAIGEGDSAVKSEGMFVDSNGAMGNGTEGRKLPSNMTPAAKRIFKMLNESPQSNEGFHANAIAQQLGMPMSEVMAAGDQLLSDGLIYTTIDDETWAILEASHLQRKECVFWERFIVWKLARISSFEYFSP